MACSNPTVAFFLEGKGRRGISINSSPVSSVPVRLYARKRLQLPRGSFDRPTHALTDQSDLEPNLDFLKRRVER
jgi:hypothetical protein